MSGREMRGEKWVKREKRKEDRGRVRGKWEIRDVKHSGKRIEGVKGREEDRGGGDGASVCA